MLFSARFYPAIAWLSLVLTALAGCARQDPAPADPQVLTWTLDGQAMTTLRATQSPNGSNIEISGGVDAVQGGAGMVLYLPKRLGTYALAPNSWDVYAAYSGGAQGLYRSSSGSITVSSLTATAMKGTFTFTGTSNRGTAPLTKTFTQGTFHVAL